MQKQITRRAHVPVSAALAQCHPVLARVYAARGVSVAEDVACRLQDLLPFQSLAGIDAAVAVLQRAIVQQQRILLIGDFDADGATSVAVAKRALKAMGAVHVDFLVPNRFEFGYGLTPEIVEVAKDFTPDVLVTVDNGIASVSGVDAAKALGWQVVVTDHHLPGEQLPKADAIVNPNQSGCQFASKNLAGVGVIFYVMLALRARLRADNWFTEQKLSEPNLGQLLDLVALGTVADVVKLDRNNRILVQQGLQRIRQGKACIGVQALLQVANRRGERLTASDLGFAIAPRLNAAGRLQDMSLGIACLLADDLTQALDQAMQLDTLNVERRSLEAQMKEQALSIINELALGDKNNLPLGVCLYEASWHQGVVGILASRIKDKLQRPVVCFSRVSDHELKGSARSVSGLHLCDTLAAMAVKQPDLMQKFGGHAMAAGLSLAPDKLADFTKAFDHAVRAQLDADQLQDSIETDGALGAEEFSLDLASVIQQGGPWGQGFPEPIFDGEFECVKQSIVGEKHIKCTLRPSQSDALVDAIAFNVDFRIWPKAAPLIKAVYRLDINEFRGQRKLQLIIEHCEASA